MTPPLEQIKKMKLFLGFGVYALEVQQAITSYIFSTYSIPASLTYLTDDTGVLSKSHGGRDQIFRDSSSGTSVKSIAFCSQ